MWYKIILLSNFLLLVSSTKNPYIVIVGAGPSGIAAATRLLENNFTNITILEAENRIGGRVNSVKFGDAYVDLGAEWCHGQKNNVVYSLVKDFNILKHTNFTPNIYYSDGKLLDEELSKELYEFVNEALYTQFNAVKEDVSLGTQFMVSYNSTILEKYKNDSKKLKVALSAIQFLESYLLGYDSAYSWYDKSYKSFYKESEGDQNLNWNGYGYKTILDVLMKKYPDPKKTLPIEDKISLFKEVTKIKSTSDNNVIIECLDDSKYEVDHVIFTPSLGVLKTKHSTIFEPKLSDDKKTAIEGLGFGAVIKVIMHFPEIWWDPNEPVYSFLWDRDEKLKIVRDFKAGVLKNGEPWILYFNFLYPAENNPNVLIAWLSGKIIPEVEILPDQVVLDGIMYTITKFLGSKFNVTQPDSTLRTSWLSNPHFLGTYSFDTPNEMKVGVNFHEKLSTPILRTDGTPAVLFAGEATHPDHYSTVHGAIETGYREADRIIELYKEG